LKGITIKNFEAQKKHIRDEHGIFSVFKMWISRNGQLTKDNKNAKFLQMQNSFSH